MENWPFIIVKKKERSSNLFLDQFKKKKLLSKRDIYFSMNKIPLENVEYSVYCITYVNRNSSNTVVHTYVYLIHFFFRKSIKKCN